MRDRDRHENSLRHHVREIKGCGLGRFSACHALEAQDGLPDYPRASSEPALVRRDGPHTPQETPAHISVY